MIKIDKLKNRLQKGEIVILDGGMGTEIMRRGEKTTLPLWSARILLDNPKMVVEIHEDYIRTGAEIITTNTFRTTKRTFAKAGLDKQARKATITACRLASEAVRNVHADHDVYVAGSIAPLEDCYMPQLVPDDRSLEREHVEYANSLKDGGVDFLLIETMNTIREATFALQAATKTGLPVAVSFCCNEKGTILSGESIPEVVSSLKDFDLLFLSINCFSPSFVMPIVRELKRLTSLPLGVYAHGDGYPDDEEGWKFDGKLTPDHYMQFVKEWINEGAQVIGGCCGTNPEFIKKISRHIKKFSNMV